jgi:predicted aspartyl protease
LPVFNLAAPQPGGAAFLQANGPIIEVELTAPVTPIASSGIQPVSPGANLIRGRALIDTGASSTFIDVAIARQLGLATTGTMICQSASHQYPANQYAVAYRFVGIPNFNVIPVADSPNLAAQNLIMLIGRDLLANAVVVYNGAAGTVSLSW